MADILSRRTALEVKEAEQGDQLRPGTVHIAPPNRHLLVNPDGTLSLTQSELVHFVRPSADLLFESVAASYKHRAIAVVLTGTGSDGTMGVQAIKKMGGTVIAQDEATSEFFGMPNAAIQTGNVDFVLPLTFTDITEYRRLQEELRHSKEELQSAYEELQSSNEELETTNEELQSTNEELETMNNELRQRGEDLNQAHLSGVDLRESARRRGGPGPGPPGHGVERPSGGPLGAPCP
jgi:hypothetical protein